LRFDKDTRTLIHEATGSVTIRWPVGAPPPEKGRVYYMQSAEDLEKEEARRASDAMRCRDVIAEMKRRQHGRYPDGYEPPKVKRKRPTKDDPTIKVIDITILRRGWEATVILYQDPDPVRHTGLKTKVPAGPHPIFGHPEKVETEPEGIVETDHLSEVQIARRNAEERDALKTEHKISVDQAKLAEAERSLTDQRRRGKSGKLQAQAIERSRKRAELVSAAAAA
jgi:hypothetical protein